MRRKARLLHGGGAFQGVTAKVWPRAIMMTLHRPSIKAPRLCGKGKSGFAAPSNFPSLLDLTFGFGEALSLMTTYQVHTLQYTVKGLRLGCVNSTPLAMGGRRGEHTPQSSAERRIIVIFTWTRQTAPARSPEGIWL